MNKSVKVKIVSILIISTLLTLGGSQLNWAQQDQEVQKQLTELKKAVEELKEQTPRIGYINRDEAFGVYPQTVQKERQEVNKLEKEIEKLKEKAEKGDIKESKFKRERDLLRAKHLKARIEVDMAILDTMIKAKGFAEINEKLKGLKKQAKPTGEKIDGLIEDIKNYSISPQQVSETLDKIGNQQFKQLDNILTNLAQLKITQVAQTLAKEKGYDLVIEQQIEQQNVILYRQKGLIHDLTPEVKKRLKTALKPSEG